MSRNAFAAALLCALVLCAAAGAPAQSTLNDDEAGVPRGELSEIRDKRRALLIVNRSYSVDTRGPLRGVVEEVFDKEGRVALRHEYAHDLVSRRLERYEREGGLKIVETLEEADFVIVYKVVALHRSFSEDEPFVYGEMFVFLNRTPERPQPVLLWRTKGDHTTPGEAAGDFLKSLKAVRGEK
ncbi:MAG TPA: hypothetical protein VF240_03070 [Pyrinomonadaceae bacterium]